MYGMEEQAFGQYAKSYRLVNQNGMQVVLTDFGARIVNILLPVEDNGGLRNVSLSCSSAEEYLQFAPYVGASIVPVAGRLFTKQIEIGGTALRLIENGPGYSLHSGPSAANLHIWKANCSEKDNAITFSMVLPDGYNGFPGPIEFRAIYHLRKDNVLEVRYQAKSNRLTIFNPTNHAFFNLTGNFHQPIGQHRLQIYADKVQAYESTGRPTQVREVAGTPFDFRQEKYIADSLQASDSQLALFDGFDHFWYINDGSKAARVTSPDGRIRLTVSTNQDGIVMYTYNKPQPRLAVKHGVFSLECLASDHRRQLLQPDKMVESWAYYAFEF